MAMVKEEDGIRQHKRMAMGEPIKEQHESFGVEPFHNVQGDVSGKGFVEHPDKHNGTESRHLHDHERGARHPIMHDGAKMHAQANADHGPHDHGHGHRTAPGHHAHMERPHARGK